MKVLIIDPVGGISGDMLLAGLIDLGCPTGVLEEAYARLDVGPYALQLSQQEVGGIACAHLRFDVPESREGRTWAHIRDRILADLPGAVRSTSMRIFEALARAEGHVHGVEAEEVHFHEVGAVDSILDIVGIAAALDHLGVEAVYALSVPLGHGTTGSLHGRIPVPAPATLRLLEGFRVRFAGPPSELATPTGAAVIRALAVHGDPPADLVVTGSGYGCGSRRFDDWPNLCRVVLGEVDREEAAGRTFHVEADIDDMIPEDAVMALERISLAGALDAGITPRIMKQGRPGYTLGAICEEAHLATVLEAFLVHTTTIGVRYHTVQRRVLPRRQYSIATSYGEVDIKEVRLPDGSTRTKPEYRGLQELAKRSGLGLAALRAEVERCLAQKAHEGTEEP
jgi:uncharacterized protein (TIGR00299 family) protein